MLASGEELAGFKAILFTPEDRRKEKTCQRKQVVKLHGGLVVGIAASNILRGRLGVHVPDVKRSSSPEEGNIIWASAIIPEMVPSISHMRQSECSNEAARLEEANKHHRKPCCAEINSTQSMARSRAQRDGTYHRPIMVYSYVRVLAIKADFFPQLTVPRIIWFQHIGSTRHRDSLINDPVLTRCIIGRTDGSLQAEPGNSRIWFKRSMRALQTSCRTQRVQHLGIMPSPGGGKEK